MSLEPPTYLSSLQNNIRARPIPWEGAVRAGNITEDHLKRIKAVDKVRKEQRRQTIEGDLGLCGIACWGWRWQECPGFSFEKDRYCTVYPGARGGFDQWYDMAVVYEG